MDSSRHNPPPDTPRGSDDSDGIGTPVTTPDPHDQEAPRYIEHTTDSSDKTRIPINNHPAEDPPLPLPPMAHV